MTPRIPDQRAPNGEAGWVPLLTADGSFTLVHPVHGEACHAREGAWTQARERYARACRMRERALEIAAGGQCVFRLLDVGTGLGLNIAAALAELDGTGVALDVVTFELDARAIEAALALGAHTRADLELERHHAPVRAALHTALDQKDAAIALGRGRLRLVLGDARATLAELAPGERFDAVFLDPFSPKSDPPLWEHAFLAEVARRMDGASLLTTYSAATAVRVGLLAAGLHVGPGGRVGKKREGTLASPDRALPAFAQNVARRLAARAMAASSPRTVGKAQQDEAPKGPMF